MNNRQKELLAEASHFMMQAADRLLGVATLNEAKSRDEDWPDAPMPEPDYARSTLGGQELRRDWADQVASARQRHEIREKERIYQECERAEKAQAQPVIGLSRPLDLVVTLNGVPFEDQALGLRLFKEACGITTIREPFTTAGVDYSGRSR